MPGLGDRHQRNAHAEWPDDATPELLPGYDQPAEQLAAPFTRAGVAVEALLPAIRGIRGTLSSPGRWFGFCHGDLQIRHSLISKAGVGFIDWEQTGLRHRLYDLACLLIKPEAVGRRIPQSAMAAAVSAYCAAAGVPIADVQPELQRIMIYEDLIGIAENHEFDPDLATGTLAELITRASRACPELCEPAAALRAKLGGERLKVYRGFAGDV